jgi:hypothetical protein
MIRLASHVYQGGPAIHLGTRIRKDQCKNLIVNNRGLNQLASAAVWLAAQFGGVQLDDRTI